METILKFFIDWGDLAGILLFLYFTGRMVGHGFTDGFKESIKENPLRIKK